MWGFDNFKRGDSSFLGFIEKEPSIFLKSEVAPDSIHGRRTYVGEYVSDNARLKRSTIRDELCHWRCRRYFPAIIEAADHVADT